MRDYGQQASRNSSRAPVGSGGSRPVVSNTSLHAAAAAAAAVTTFLNVKQRRLAAGASSHQRHGIPVESLTFLLFNRNGRLTGIILLSRH